MDELSARLEHLMSGLNFVTTFVLLPLPPGTSLDDAEAAIAEEYPEAELTGPRRTDATEVWEEIDHAFAYRGDPSDGSGMDLAAAQESELRELQDRYRTHVREFINPESVVYAGGCRGLPGYPVFWGYTLLILNPTRNGLLLFAAASD
ncbi:hypothetical protein [Actinomadura chibensis]|uniref:Uncharacterized protein n=1 Tax=Actinomadura chibensis TaxID=392828 RepID=A0A5D0NMZ9_9ACTN|nr:hypothetical protein [Actinomadura chibensis]TYB45648.1 hypothetical protein FXF69_19705 [Actinomadura chibensis]